MKLSNIYYHDEYGNTDLVATTNTVDKWLKSSNEDRIRDGHDAESLDDFEIKEFNAHLYLMDKLTILAKVKSFCEGEEEANDENPFDEDIDSFEQGMLAGRVEFSSQLLENITKWENE